MLQIIRRSYIHNAELLIVRAGGTYSNQYTLNGKLVHGLFAIRRERFIRRRAIGAAQNITL
jgi:hypothetical protein